MKRLIEGYFRFKSEVYPQHRELFRTLASRQTPEVMLIACSDSRVVPSFMLQTGPGELFILRNAGNIVPAYGDHMVGGVSATIEYAVQVLKVKHIIVCGHSDCGAMKAALHAESLSGLPAVSKWLRQTEPALAVVRETTKGMTEEQVLSAMIEENVRAQLSHLVTHPCVAAKTRIGELQLHGWVYDIPNGEFLVYDAADKRFVPLASMVSTLLESEEPANV